MGYMGILLEYTPSYILSTLGGLPKTQVSDYWVLGLCGFADVSCKSPRRTASSSHAVLNNRIFSDKVKVWHRSKSDFDIMLSVRA